VKDNVFCWQVGCLPYNSLRKEENSMTIINKLNQYYHQHQNTIKKISFFLKLIFSLLLLHFLFSKVSFNDTMTHISKLPVSVVIMLIITTIIKFYIQMLNWKSLLKIDPKVNLKYGDVFRTHTLGLLFKLVIPGGQGSFGKMFYLRQISKKSAFFIILLEKFFQTWIFFIAGCLAGAYYFKNFAWLFLILFMLSFLLPFYLPRLFKKATSEHKWKRYIRKMPVILISQLLFLGLTFYQYYCILVLFDQIKLFDLVINVSLILFATLIPISYSGLGIRESASVYLFAQSGIIAETAIACSLIIFFFNSVIPALPGLFYFIRKREH